MAWYDEAIFYHIYPLGLCDAPKENTYSAPVHRLNEALPWIGHIKKIGCNAIYIGPLFESVGHGYETTDYKKLGFASIFCNPDCLIDGCNRGATFRLEIRVTCKYDVRAVRQRPADILIVHPAHNDMVTRGNMFKPNQIRFDVPREVAFLPYYHVGSHCDNH